jgi:hypothetical protein
MKNISLTNTSPAGCDVTIAMASDPTDATCQIYWGGGVSGPIAPVEGDIISNPLSGPSVSAIVEGNTPSTVYGTLACYCPKLAKAGTADSISTSVQVSSSNCPVSVGGTLETVTCKQ